MKLAIVELETHAECVHALASLLSDEQALSVSLFLADHVYKELEKQSYINKFQVVVKPAHQSCRAFFDTHQNHLQQQQIIILNTLHRFYQQYPLDRWPATILLRIHNARFYFDKWRAFSMSSWLRMSWPEIKYNLKLLCMEWDWYYVNKITKRVDWVSFMDTAMQQYALQQNWVEKKRVLQPLPLTFSGTNKPEKQAEEYVHIAVPGSVDNRRKDYDFVVEVFEALLPLAGQPIKLTLLGKADKKAQKRWVLPLQELAHMYPRFSLQWFDNRIEQGQFEAIMGTVDFLLAPVQPFYFFKTYKEQYGRTKMSGINADIIKYCKPCFLPESYLAPASLLPMIMSYKNKDDLLQQLKQAITASVPDKDFVRAAEDIQLLYAQSRQKQEFIDLLQNLSNQKG